MKTNMKKLILTGVALAAMTLGANAAIVLGDIAIVGIAGDTKAITFVTLNDIAAGSTISFTDSAWLSDTNAFRGSEGGATYTFASATSAGAIITGIGGTDTEWNNLPGWDAISDSVLGTNGLGVNTAGDGVLAFTGTDTSPTFVHAVASVPFGFSTSSSSTGINTAVPTGLTEGTSAVSKAAGPLAGDEYDNIWYSGPTSFASASAAFAAINNSANWTGNNSTYTPITSFSIVPEPATWALLGIGAAFVLWRKRRMA